MAEAAGRRDGRGAAHRQRPATSVEHRRCRRCRRRRGGGRAGRRRRTVTAHAGSSSSRNAWGSNWGERAAATRLVAGALALRADVVIVSIEDRSRRRHRQDRLRHDGLFPVYSAAAPTGRGTAGGIGTTPRTSPPRHCSRTSFARPCPPARSSAARTRLPAGSSPGPAARLGRSARDDVGKNPTWSCSPGRRRSGWPMRSRLGPATSGRRCCRPVRQ